MKQFTQLQIKLLDLLFEKNYSILYIEKGENQSYQLLDFEDEPVYKTKALGFEKIDSVVKYLREHNLTDETDFKKGLKIKVLNPMYYTEDDATTLAKVGYPYYMDTLFN